MKKFSSILPGDDIFIIDFITLLCNGLGPTLRMCQNFLKMHLYFILLQLTQLIKCVDIIKVIELNFYFSHHLKYLKFSYGINKMRKTIVYAAQDTLIESNKDFKILN